MRNSYLPAVFEGFDESWPSSMNQIMRNMMNNMGVKGFDERLTMSPQLDFYRKDGKLFVEAELPGIKPEDVDLHVYSDRLTLSAEKKSEHEEKDSNNQLLRGERYYGKVERSIAFPVEVDPSSAKASFKHGVLKIEVAENTKPQDYKKIAITAEP